MAPPVCGAPPEAVGAPHGDFVPNCEEEPNAGAGAWAEPNADAPVLPPNGDDVAAGAGVVVFAEALDASAMVKPGYVVPFLIESLYTSHQAQRRPS